MLFICYPKCSTCQKAKKWLDEHNVEYTERHIVESNPSYEELKLWHEKSGLALKKFFNTSGLLYKEDVYKRQLILQCNLSDLYSNVQVTARKGSREVS